MICPRLDARDRWPSSSRLVGHQHVFDGCCTTTNDSSRYTHPLVLSTTCCENLLNVSTCQSPLVLSMHRCCSVRMVVTFYSQRISMCLLPEPHQVVTVSPNIATLPMTSLHYLYNPLYCRLRSTSVLCIT